ncbi:hypothetical protein [Sandaracinobacter neustonicus]|uniref:hypothetical protein n=1 Tax=Sandaracinobacter neustonicus TaxID=1715348 RepID=UPI0015E3EB9F|nr:hypothetical protein [Sandaracinobacter neustonicus]
MTKTVLTLLAVAIATPVLAQQPSAPTAEKKCCCDKKADEAMDHSKMGHEGAQAPK